MASAYHAARLDARQRGRAGGMEFWFGVFTDGLVRAPVEHLHMTMSDLRYAARGLMRTPMFTIVAILTIALGIGANTAIFSAVRAVALRPLGLTDAERLVRIWEKNDRLKIRRFAVSVPNYVDWREQSTVFDELGAWRERQHDADDRRRAAAPGLSRGDRDGTAAAWRAADDRSKFPA